MHTSVSLTLSENADPEVTGDLEQFMNRLVTEQSDYFLHTQEGSDVRVTK